MNGSEASIVGPEERTPGRASRENARSDGSAESSETSAGVPTREHVAQRGDGLRAAPCPARANASERDVELGHEVLERAGFE